KAIIENLGASRKPNVSGSAFIVVYYHVRVTKPQIRIVTRPTVYPVNRRGWRLSNATQIETRSIEYVPLAERHGKVWHLWPVWFAGDAHLSTLATGVIGVTLGLNLLWSAVAIVAGCIFGTFFMA